MVAHNPTHNTGTPQSDTATQNVRLPTSCSQLYSPPALPPPVLNVLFTRALSSRLSTKPFIGLTVCPGFCVSNLRSGWTGIGIVINFVLELLFARTTEVGSRQLVWAALAGKKGHEEELRGAYVANTRIEEASDWVLSEEGKRVQDLLWVRTYFAFFFLSRADIGYA